MRRIAVAITLLVAACDDAPASEGGASGAGSSTGDGLETDGGEESTGDAPEWDGETITVRAIEASGGSHCDHACGGSACLGAQNFDTDLDCNEGAEMLLACSCGDDAETAGTPATHGVSDCYLDPNAASDGFSMTRPDPWDGRSCDEFCGDSGLGPCAWTHWVPGDDGCFDWGAQGGVRQYGKDMTVRTPFASGEGGIVRFVCEI